MSYICNAMTAIQHINEFAGRRNADFSKKELVEHLITCGITASSTEKALQRLVQSGNIEKGSGRGLYRNALNRKPEFIVSPSEGLAALYEQIKKEFPLLEIVALDIHAIMPLMHHIPNVKMTLLYAEKDGFSDVADTLETITDKLVFRNPSRNDLVHLAFGRDFIVIRPLVSQSPVESCKGVRCPKIEKILVDILCDEEFYYLQGNETYEIYKTALADYSINQKALIRYAGRRSATEKVKQIIKTIKDDTSGE